MRLRSTLVLDALRQRDMTTPEIAARIGFDPDKVKHHVRRLRIAGKVRVIGELRRAYPNLYTVRARSAPRSAEQIMGAWHRLAA